MIMTRTTWLWKVETWCVNLKLLYNNHFLWILNTFQKTIFIDNSYSVLKEPFYGIFFFKWLEFKAASAKFLALKPFQFIFIFQTFHTFQSNVGPVLQQDAQNMTLCGGFWPGAATPKSIPRVWVERQGCMPKYWYTVSWNESKLKRHSPLIWSKHTLKCKCGMIRITLSNPFVTCPSASHLDTQCNL